MTGTYMNKRKKYAIVDRNGKVIEYFRLKSAATNYKIKLNKDKCFFEVKYIKNSEKFKIVKTEDLKNETKN